MKVNNKKIYNLCENESFSLDNSSKELLYIKQNFKNCFEFTRGKNETILRGKNIVGVLDLGDSIYRIYPKVGDILNIFNMISKVSTHKHKKINENGYLYLDSNVFINVEENSVKITNAIIEIFLNELNKVSRMGYTKNYTKNIKKISFLRGKLDVNKQVRENILGTKFYCKFNELTFYTPENIILYKAIDKLLKRHNLSKQIKRKLLFYKNEMLCFLQNYDMNNIDVNNIIYCKNRTNSYYETVIAISEIILKDRFASSLKYGNSKFCNFIVRMDLLFEQYIFILIEELINEKYKGYYLEYQYMIKSILKVDSNFNQLSNNEFLKMNSDILIIEKETERPILVIDTKYIDIYNKNKLSNYTYYQMISYLIGLNTGIDRKKDISAILLAHGNNGNIYKIPDLDCNMYIMTKGINILDTEQNIKNKLDKILIEFLKDDEDKKLYNLKDIQEVDFNTDQYRLINKIADATSEYS